MSDEFPFNRHSPNHQLDNFFRNIPRSCGFRVSEIGRRAVTIETKKEAQRGIMKYTKLAITLTSFALFVPAVFAQDATTTPPVKKPTIEQRKDNQQQRIGNGVQNGSLTAGETKRLENREANLNKETKTMRQADNGKLTQQDRRVLNRQQNNLSKNIYNQKHDAQVQPKANNEVNARQKLQQQRVAQGIKSGSLTPAETAKLESKDAKINHEVKDMREDNGGKLTPAERAKVNQKQNRVSQQIYNKNHNAQVQK